MDGRSRALLALLIATTDALQRTIRLSGKPHCAALRATGPSWAHGGVSDRAFGVEIELLSDDVDDLADAVARAGEDVIIANTVTVHCSIFGIESSAVYINSSRHDYIRSASTNIRSVLGKLKTIV